MEDVIERILKIEEMAQEIVRDAEKARAGFEEEITAECERIGRDIKARANSKNDMLREYEDGEADKKIAAINEQTERTMKALDAKLDQNREKWVSEIVAGVIGGGA